MRINEDLLYNNNFDSLLSLGLMSGTSLDGLDIALVQTNGLKKINFISFNTYKYPNKLKSNIENFIKKRNRPNDLERFLNDFNVNSIKSFIKDNKIDLSSIKIIGLHGHTIFHKPEENWTWQLGDGQYLSNIFKIPVISNFRYRDVCLGGEGAPLVPVWHFALLNNIKNQQYPCAVVNVGGISNMTLIFKKDKIPISFDFGTGNAPLDYIMKKHFNKDFDMNGKNSLKGRISYETINEILNDKWFNIEPPKSLDKFQLNNILLKNTKNLAVNDRLATLSKLISLMAKKAISFYKIKPKIWYISGGGRLNKSIIKGFKEEFGKNIYLAEDVGLNGDAMEAEAFAYLAVRSFKGLPLTWKTTTGVQFPTSGGVLNYPIKF